jgi:hypothetical protein
VSGRWFTIAVVALSVSIALLALWHRSRDTAHVRDFWGADVANLIQNATHVELRKSHIAAGEAASQAKAPSVDDFPIVQDISTAPGLVHLRATLVEDRYFRWPWRLATPEELADRSRYCLLRFSNADASIDIAFDSQHGTLIHLSTVRVVQLIPTSRQAIVRYLEELPASIGINQSREKFTLE